jgi:hypothetical protein
MGGGSSANVAWKAKRTSLERSSLRPEELGLTLAEAKTLLRNMQQTMVTEQISEYLG